MKYVKNRYGYQKKRKQKKTGRIIVGEMTNAMAKKKKKIRPIQRDLAQVNYKFQGARYRSGSDTRNRIIPLVRDKLYANRS